MWLWSLVADVQAGREASAALAVTEERLRFARDVHDLLGHRLSIIALKAELISRVATERPDAAAREASEVRHIAATALDDVRAAVSDSRRIDLARELEALRAVLEASGVRCSMEAPAEVPPGDRGRARPSCAGGGHQRVAPQSGVTLCDVADAGEWRHRADGDE